MKKVLCIIMTFILIIPCFVMSYASETDYSEYDYDNNGRPYGNRLKYVSSSDGNWIYSVLADGTIAIKMGDAMCEKLKEPDGNKITEERFVDVVVPETIDGYEVSVIGYNAFWVARLMRSIVLPKSVKRISTYAFWYCDFLTEVTLNDGLESLAQNAFCACKRLAEISMPKSLKSIEKGAFNSCDSLKKITIYDGVEYIGEDQFFTNATIYGYSGSYAEEYAIANNYSFVSIGKAHCDHLNCYDVITGSCTEDGLKQIICNDCGETVYSEVIPAPGHVKGESVVTKQPAVGEAGELTVYCSACGEIIDILPIEPLEDPYKGFADVKQGSWYYDSVKYTFCRGFISGYFNGLFGPNDSLKRQDFVVMIARIANADLSEYQGKVSKLKDVKPDAYYAAAVNWAVDNGIAAGYENGKFGVNDNITREQVATILYRYVKPDGIVYINNPLKSYPDYDSISYFAKDTLLWAVLNGIISGMGDGRLAPTESASRAQIVSILERMDKQGFFTN